MNYLKNVKISHDERRDIDYVKDVEVLEKLPSVGEELDGKIVGSIDKSYVDISETRQEDYNFYEMYAFDANTYLDDVNIYGATHVNKNDYLSDKIIAIKKEEE